MRVEAFIAKRLSFSKQSGFSSFIIKIAIVAVCLSVAVMIIATALVNGFKKEIENKVFGFMGSIQISSFESNHAFQNKPIAYNPKLSQSITTLDAVTHVQTYANITTILKSPTEMEGIALKGVGFDFNWQFFEKYMYAGKPFVMDSTKKSNEIVLSKTTADRLKVEIGDKVNAYFIKDPPRIRSFKISGIFNTGLIEYDMAYALIDIRHVQKLSNWNDKQIQGYEVFIDDANALEKTNNELFFNILGPDLLSQTLKEINPSIFNWLELQSVNEKVIFALMIIVAVINMITTLLILIMERTNMIGILKALGASNWTIRKLFLYNAAFIVGFGLLFGNFFGLGLCFFQDHFGFIQLSEESYFIKTAPVYINWWIVLIINLATLVICIFSLLLPSYLITKISPVKAIRFS